MKHPDGTPLRNGFTTGAAATAAAVGAWTAQNGAPPPEQVELLLPDGSFLAIPLERCAPGTATVRKDGGDDPDVTDRAEIKVELRPGSCDDPRAFSEQCGAGRLYLTGGEGVGVVTRPGLAVPPGHFAINPGPRRMLVKNLERAGFGKAPGEELTIVISVPAGKVLAEKTLNPTLGIVGGISILGNSGIVRPYSNAAYAATVALPFLLIVREPDLGSSLILLPIFVVILFTAGLKWRYILLAGLTAGILGGAAVLNEAMQIRPMLKEYQRDRIRVFLNPELDRTDTGYNSYQARLAVGSGGLTGKGIGEGTQNTLGFLPQTVSNNDFIFSVIAEEVGFLGCLLLIAAYLALFYSIIRTAFLTTDPFGRYLAVGIGSIIFSHCFINIGMSIGLAPVTGLSLPFVSYGGSFMLMGLAACGLLQSVYRYRNSH